MRMIFGVLSLLFVVAVVGFLAKKQMSSINDIKVPQVVGPAAGSAPVAPVVNPGGNVQQQSQQIQQQFKAAAEAAVQQPRPMPDDNK
jgi:hypothetical protein